MTDVDIIIVGAGAAGCVLANRLSRDPALQVLLIEAGGRNRGHPLVEVPKGFVRTISDPRFTTTFHGESTHGNAERDTWIRGRGLGGSTVINGTMYCRGGPEDFDALAAAGNPEWSWDQVLPAYRAMEDHALGPSPMRGVHGPLPIDVPGNDDPLAIALLEAAKRRGLSIVPDVNATMGERIGFTPATIRSGRRVTAARAFLSSVRGRDNLTVLTHRRAERLLFDGDRVVGVVTGDANGGVHHHRATSQVVLSAGTVGSPLLLERSGIGEETVLRRAGIDVRVASPNVGNRIVEQRQVIVKARTMAGSGTNPRLNTTLGRIREALRWLLTRSGPLATPAYDLTGLVQLDPDHDRPDAQVLLSPLSTDASGLDVSPHAGLMVVGYPLRPSTPSSIHVRGPALAAPPRLTTRYLDAASERRLIHRLLQWIRALLGTPPVAGFVTEEYLPGPGVTSERQAVRHALDAGSGIYHAVGSCGMGPDGDDVVDSRLRVRGVDGLRVVDASVFPTSPSGGTAAPTMALAHRASDLILQDL